MARYFFHLTSPDESSKDDIGTELPNAEAAYLEACETALEISYEMLRERRDPSHHAFEVMDVAGRVVFEIPFAEVTRPAQCVPPFGEIHASIQRHQERASRAVSELRENVGRTQSLLNSTRALLAKV
jgi:hypothetical protein